MRYNTGNPVGPDGSSDPRDLFDNAGIIDQLMTGPLGEYLDRLGVPLKSWRGIMQQVTDYLIAQGYESIYLAYGAGVVVERQTQLVQRSGELYRVMNASDIPLTLTGTWTTDAPKLQAVGDAALRQALASPTGAEMVKHGAVTVAAELTQHSQDIADANDAIDNLSVKLDAAVAVLSAPNAAQPLISRSNKVLGTGQGVVILGDSISAGAYFGNAHTNGWPNLLAKAINNLFGSRNLGASPMDSLYNVVAEYNTDQLHAVTWFGDWGTRASTPSPYNVPLGNVGTAAGNAVNGKTVQSTNSGAYVEFTLPSMNALALIYYVKRPGGGIFNVTVNGVAQASLDTSNSLVVYNNVWPIALADNGQGEVTVRLTKADTNITELQTVIQYRKGEGGPFDHFPLMNVCNHSISGRQLRTMTEAGIIAATNCACLIMALSYNDSLAETDDDYYAAYVQRINWVIQYANINQCLVVVPDFCWYSPKTSRRRAQLRRIAAETNGIYIPFPDKFYPDGRIAVDTTPSPSDLVSNLQLFADNAHPSHRGNAMIFHEIAKALGLPITTRRQALEADMPFPLKLQGTLKNKAGSVSSVTRVRNGLIYSLAVTANGGGNISSGSVPVASLPTKFGQVQSVRASTSINSISTGGAVNSFLSVAENGDVAATIVNASEIAASVLLGDK